MTSHSIAKVLFWLLAAVVLFLALTPGSLVTVLATDTEQHYLAFLVLPAVALYGWPRAPLPMIWLAFVAFGGAIEALQLVMGLGRVAEWRDWMNDMVATTISLVVAAILLRRTQTRTA